MVRQVPDVTRLLDRLEEMKLVFRKRSGSDRRYVGTTITPAGLRLLGRLDEVIVAFHERHFGHLDDSPLGTLVRLLASIRHPR